INAQGEIIHFNGDTSPYLHPSTGKPTFHIFRMARPFLEYGIRQPVQEALETGMPTRVVLREEDGKPVMVEVIPAEENFLVLFRENHFAEAESYQDQGANWLQMQKEMKRWRDDIITVTEEREVAFEELQSTHEELISRTEEMQLANEELESATESLHSTNEELRTMNEELQNRQQQIIVQRNFSDAIIATMHEPIAVIDEGFAILRVNPAFCRYVNLSENRVLGESLHDIAGLDRQEISPLLNTVFKEGIVLDGCQLEGSFAFGKRSLLLNASVIANASPKAVLIAFKDMSETMNAYRLLEAKNRELEIYNRELWMFGSAANHDLQEPLRKTLMFARRMLDDESIGNASRHFLERIISVTENMQNLVSDTIDYMQSSPEKKFRNTDLSHVARQSYAELEDVIAARSATVTIGPLPHSLVLPSQIKHLFTSLIMNAISYGRPNVPPEVVIGVEEIKLGELPEISGSENKFCKVRIADNGQGFDKDKADRIFEPFYRLHSKDAIPGNGLGLTICKKIMINHNGFIKACGRKNGGCTIDLYFPRAEK
ncbi:MAG: PAS domain-containing protein, partial [Flavobacterium sp.]